LGNCENKLHVSQCPIFAHMLAVQNRWWHHSWPWQNSAASKIYPWLYKQHLDQDNVGNPRTNFFHIQTTKTLKSPKDVSKQKWPHFHIRIKTVP
jgi:hypothetical protein